MLHRGVLIEVQPRRERGIIFQKHDGRIVIVPHAYEGHDRERSHDGQRHRKHDAHHRGKVPCPVQKRRFHIVPRETPEKAVQHEKVEPEPADRGNEHCRVVKDAERAVHRVLRRECADDREHHRKERDAVDDLSAGEFVFGDDVCAHRGRSDRENGASERPPQRVEQHHEHIRVVGRKRSERVDIIRPVDDVGEVRLVVDVFGFRFERRHERP